MPAGTRRDRRQGRSDAVAPVAQCKARPLETLAAETKGRRRVRGRREHGEAGGAEREAWVWV